MHLVNPGSHNLPHGSHLTFHEIRHLVLSDASHPLVLISAIHLTFLLQNVYSPSINPLGIGQWAMNFSLQDFGFSTTFFAIASSLSFEATWTDSNSSCVWRSRKRDRMPVPAGATGQMPLHLHPSSFRHPNPMGIYSSCNVGFSPSQPCSHGSLVDGC